MFASFATLVVAALSVSALPVPTRNHKTITVRDAPAGWAHGYLESYDVYHDRYIALSCQGRHGDAFFESCCHPLLASETLEGNRDAMCDPKNLIASSFAAVEVAPTTTAAAAPAAAATSSAAAVQEEEEEECETESEYSSAAASAQTTVAAAPAQTTAAATTAAVATSVAVEAAVVPTTTAAAPAPTTTAAAPAATTAAAAPSGDEKTGGFATYFLQNGNPGACGNYNPDSLPLVAITAEYYGGDAGQASSNCGKYVQITNTDSGKSVTAIVADLCPTCVNGNSLDLSEGAFTAIATKDQGMVPIKWSWA